MQYLETHGIALYQEVTFRPAHALVPISAGPRCRICGRLHHHPSSGILCGGYACATYKTGDARFSALAWNFCQFQDHFKIWCEQHLNRTWIPVTGLGGTGAWWWETTNVFFSQSEGSLVHIGPWLTSMLAQGWSHGTSTSSQSTLITNEFLARGGPIVEIREFKFQTTVYYVYLHCAFAIKLADNSWWVFDPTGVQFGPDWPLLSPLDDYLRHAESSLPDRRRSFRWRQLGFNTWKYSPRPPW